MRAKTPQRKWGVPDWLNANAYPSCKTASALQWLWEFRRRVAEYRADWERHFRAVTGAAPWCEMPGCQERWRMKFLIDPAVTDMLTYALAFDVPALQVVSDLPGDPSTYRGDGNHLNEHRRFYAFDVSKPIKPQIADATVFLEAQREAAGFTDVRFRKEWPLYLRAVDAHDAGATKKKSPGCLATPRVILTQPSATH